MPQKTAHPRIMWAPPAQTRLRAVRSELETLSLLEGQRLLTSAEQGYRDHLNRREIELLEETALEDHGRASLERAEPAAPGRRF